MDIHLHNYEAYFLDYHEGNLSLDSIKELMEFLSLHPELREEFESFEPVTLQDVEEIAYQEKDALKKQNTGINPGNFDELAIEYVEGTLSGPGQEELKEFIQKNPHFRKELELYTKTKLIPDNTVIFEDKSSLKKGTKRPVAWYYWSAAASVAIIVGAYFVFNRNEVPVINRVAQHSLVKDSSLVANQTVKTIDTNIRNASKNVRTTPDIHKTKNNHAIASVQQRKQHKNGKVVLPAMTKDSAIVTINGTPDKNQMAPVKKLSPLPVLPEDSLPVAQNNDAPDTSSSTQPLIIVRNPEPEIEPKKKKSKFLIMLATLTCKELHKVTGQHIELKKQYASDTTTIVAYQLDLGNKKFEFPVKE